MGVSQLPKSQSVKVVRVIMIVVSVASSVGINLHECRTRNVQRDQSLLASFRL